MKHGFLLMIKTMATFVLSYSTRLSKTTTYLKISPRVDNKSCHMLALILKHKKNFLSYENPGQAEEIPSVHQPRMRRLINQ